MLIGDAEILGQVKVAYAQARTSGSAGKTLHRIFRDAINAGKESRTRTSIGNASVSVATAAIAKAKEHIGSLAGKTVLVIGAGKMGTTAAKRLKLEGAAEFAIVNRTHERALELVKKLGCGQAIEPDLLNEALAASDVVITSTGAPHFVLTPQNVEDAMSVRPGRPMVLIDIAIPRDVDPSVASIPGVTVHDIDTMNKTIDVTLDHRRAAVPLVEAIIASHIDDFDTWYRSRASIPVISSLARKAEAIRNNEMEKLIGKCPGLTARERGLVAGMSMTIVSKLLHSAIVKIREDSGEAAEIAARARIIDELFELQLDQSKLAEQFWEGLAASESLAYDEGPVNRRRL
jgi:glutamyl-tRNA reductase